MSLRRRLFEQLDPASRHGEGLSAINTVLAVLIVGATLLGILETEPTLARPYGLAFNRIELALGVTFLVEYAIRVWTAAERHHGAEPWRSRLNFVISAAGLADLLVVIVSLLPVAGSSALLLRLGRLMRILRLAKLGRMSRAMNHVMTAVMSRRGELLISLGVGLSTMVVSATALYLAEGQVQPEKFGSIPRAMWWSVMTMTTIGYGDVYPITPLGKVLAAVTALFSIGLIAMPTGILAAAFSDGIQRLRREQELGDG